jgi:hypothetical protein
MKVFALLAILVLSLLMVTPIFAAEPTRAGNQVWANLDDAADKAGFDIFKEGEDEVPAILGRMINLLLGALGTVAVFLIVYSGFLWMTAGGNEDQISKAKTIMKQVVVGLLVLSLAYAVVAFVVSLVARGAA